RITILIVPSDLPPLPLFLQLHGAHRDLLSFPTRRSSDLHCSYTGTRGGFHRSSAGRCGCRRTATRSRRGRRCRQKWTVRCIRREDRKSTRLNSSHVSISYAVFCLKKKRKIHITDQLYCES